MFLKLAFKSLLNRKGSVVLTLMAMTVSVFVLLAVEHIRHQAKESFSNTVSGVDLIVGARSGSLNLLLYSVFRIGTPTNNISWESYEEIASNTLVKWAIPISLGDSHRGYRVVGTSSDYFEYFSYGKKHKLEFSNGQPFNHIYDVVLGAEVARKLGYDLNDKLVLSHGVTTTSFSKHDDRPFTVVGILKATGTPVDETLHVSLQGIEAIHIGWKNGVKVSGAGIADEATLRELQPKSITAFMLGLKSRISTFSVQRVVNDYSKEPMMAILPGVALSELWRMIGVLEKVLLLVAVLVFVAALLGLSAMLLSSIRDRANEIRLLRVIGASPAYLVLLIELEALLITVTSFVLGAVFLVVGLQLAQEGLGSQFGLHISNNIFSTSTLYFAVSIVIASIVVAVIPALSAYRSARAC